MMIAFRPCLLLFTFICILNVAQTYANYERKTYIVYMGSLPRDLEANSLPSLHMSMAQKVLGSDFTPGAVIYSYHKSFNGFVVKLTEAEAARMRGLDCVISVFESKRHQVATTKSWDFIHFGRDVPRQTQEESNIVVAVIDTGIWSQHESFNIKDGEYPQSKKMKNDSQNFECNNKIVQAKSIRGGHVVTAEYPNDDTLGHGTHVASIIAGREIEGAKGTMVDLTEPDENRRTVRGGVPGARIAVYKVCWPHKDDGRPYFACKDEDIIRAFEEAIADRVDIISVSLGQTSTDIDCSKEYFNNSFAIGAFHAMQNKIMTSLAADNHGPDPYSMTTYAPWLLSVAASTIGRNFYTHLTVHKDGLPAKAFPTGSPNSNDVPQGVSLNTYPSDESDKPLSNSCRPSPAKPMEILICPNEVPAPRKVGELEDDRGIVLKSDKPLDFAKIYASPATVLSKDHFEKLLEYGGRLAKMDTSVVEDLPMDTNPFIVSISSRGPNPISHNILKPDIASPGVNILAAWPHNLPVSLVPEDTRKNNADYKYSVRTGTSMACAHATAAAAYVKSFHPDWSPAAIKSALMTTATKMETDHRDGAEFAYGAGQINPKKAIHPGLVYNASADDYLNFLCAEGYNKEKMKCFNKNKAECTDDDKKEGRVENLNLPSFALSVDCNFKDGKKCQVDGSFTRTVENVEAGNSIYKYEISPSPTPSPLKIEVTIHPKKTKIEARPDQCLSFEKEGDKQTFTLKITGELTEKGKDSASSLWMEKVSASLTWRKVDSCGQNAKFIDAGYEVRSPIVVYNRNGSPKRQCETASKPIVTEGIAQIGYQEGREDASTLVA